MRPMGATGEQDVVPNRNRARTKFVRDSMRGCVVLNAQFGYGTANTLLEMFRVLSLKRSQLAAEW
jgi:hypothetical protein